MRIRDEVLEFSRDRIAAAISGLEPSRRLAVCAACAQRLIPFVDANSGAQAQVPSSFRTVLDIVWSQLLGLGSPLTPSEIDELCQAARAQVPDEDDLVPGYPYAQDAAIAVTYALETWRTGDTRSTALCLEQAYNVVDNYVLNQTVPDGTISEQAETNIVQDAIVQAELTRQCHDIELCRKTDESQWRSVLSQMRAEAMQAQIIPKM